MNKEDIAAQWVDISVLVPWNKNPRKNDHAVERVARSIERLGFGAPIIARKANNEVIAGHTRLKAAESLGMTRVPVRFLDISEKDAHLMALADNKLGEISDWEPIPLAEAMSEFAFTELELAGWDGREIEKLAEDVGDDILDDDDESPPPPIPESSSIVIGDVFQMGVHRLVCGDSTSPDVLRVATQDRLADMICTDPPYGIGYTSPWDNREPIENDARDDELEPFLSSSFSSLLSVSKKGAPWYVCAPPGAEGLVFGQLLIELGVMRQKLVWVKDTFVLGRSDYHYRHEDIYYGWTPGAAHVVPAGGDRTIDTVWEFPRPRVNKEHPTMKPVALIRRCIEYSSKPGDLVIEPFGGSGTALVACEETGRECAIVELSPLYCDVIIQRWEKMTGLKAEKVEL